MKKVLVVITLGLGFLAGCNNQPFGMAITLHSKQVTPEIQKEVVQTGRVDPSIPTASSVFIDAVLEPTALEVASETEACLSVAACN